MIPIGRQNGTAKSDAVALVLEDDLAIGLVDGLESRFVWVVCVIDCEWHVAEIVRGIEIGMVSGSVKNMNGFDFDFHLGFGVGHVLVTWSVNEKVFVNHKKKCSWKHS